MDIGSVGGIELSEISVRFLKGPNKQQIMFYIRVKDGLNDYAGFSPRLNTKGTKLILVIGR